MNVIEGQAKQNEKIQSDFLYSLTFNNILNIIIMLILVSVSTNIAINSGLFQSAGKGAKDTKNALNAEQELAGGKVNIGGRVYESIEEYRKIKQNGSISEIISKEKAQNTKLNSANVKEVIKTKTELMTYEAPIPVGFTISGKESERSIDGGLVIYLIDDKTEAEIAAIDWEDAETVLYLQKTYDQFVWIPIPRENINNMYICQAKTENNGKCDITVNSQGEAECQTHKTGDSTKAKLMAGRLYATVGKFEEGYTEVYTANSDLREPGIVTGSDGLDYDNKTDYLAQLNNILGTNFAPTTDRTNNTGTTNTDLKTYLQEEYNEVVKSVYENQGFYVGRYETSKMANTDTNPTIKVVAGANSGTLYVNWYRMYAQQKKYAENKRLTAVKSSIIQGAAYDQVMKFVEGGIRPDGRTYTINEMGNVAHTSSQGLNAEYATGGLNYPSTATIAYNDCVKNIYDLEGNRLVMTLEANNEGARSVRGSCFYYNGTASDRGGRNPRDIKWIIGSMSQLYVIL